MIGDSPTENPSLLSVWGVNHAAVTAVVRQALGRSAIAITDVQAAPIYGGGSGISGGVAGVYRVTGIAHDADGDCPWSLIFKIIGMADGRRDPAGPLYWKREFLAYQSRLLETLPGRVRAARCYGTVELSDSLIGLWFEELVDAVGPRWPLEQYAVVAHHFGQFNAAFINSPVLTSQPWLCRGWLRRFVEQEGQQTVTLLREYQSHNLVGQIYTTEISERIVRLWDDRTVLLDAIERLPQTLCHNDAFRRNLFMCRAPDGEPETVAIDWATVGTGAVGQELGMLVAGTLEFQEVDIAQAAQLDTLAFEGYLDGLRSAGWRDDPRKVRFAYAAAAPLISELGYVAPFVTFLTEQDNNVEWIEQTFGAPIDELTQLWVQTIGFRLRLADEARVLIDSIG